MIPAIIPPTAVTKMKFLKKKVLECLQATKDMEIGLLKPATTPLVISEVIIVVMLVYVDIGHTRIATIPL